MLQLDYLKGKTIAVWGVGVETLQVLHLLPDTVKPVIISDNLSSPECRDAANRFNALLCSPMEAIEKAKVDVLVRSPAVSLRRQEFQEFESRGVVITSLLQLWFEQRRDLSILGITGTKGKSTTSLLVAELLTKSGEIVQVGGNIGTPVSTIGWPGHAIVEVSSYQAADLTISPKFGLLTNLGSDHLPWHGSLERYHRDKLRLFANPEIEKLIVPNSLKELVRKQLPNFNGELVSPSDLGLEVVGGELRLSEKLLVDLNATALSPEHLSENFLLACAMATVVLNGKISHQPIYETARSFILPEGRLEVVSRSGAIEWITDTLASNPLGAAAGVKSFEKRNLILIVGGMDRGVDPEPLLNAIRNHPQVRLVIAIGAAGVAWRRSLESIAEVKQLTSDDPRQAVVLARKVALPGDVVLFSPGAPTSPEVGNWRDRMHLFQDAIASFTPDLPR